MSGPSPNLCMSTATVTAMLVRPSLACSHSAGDWGGLRGLRWSREGKEATIEDSEDLESHIVCQVPLLSRTSGGVFRGH